MILRIYTIGAVVGFVLSMYMERDNIREEDGRPEWASWLWVFLGTVVWFLFWPFFLFGVLSGSGISVGRLVRAYTIIYIGRLAFWCGYVVAMLWHNFTLPFRMYAYRRSTSTRTNADLAGLWQPISTAPRDGSLILVSETPNGERWNALPAAWMDMHKQGHPRWWAVTPGRVSGFWELQPGNVIPRTKWVVEHSARNELPIDFSPIAVLPKYWMPLPGSKED